MDGRISKIVQKHTKNFPQKMQLRARVQLVLCCAFILTQTLSLSAFKLTKQINLAGSSFLSRHSNRCPQFSNSQFKTARVVMSLDSGKETKQNSAWLPIGSAKSLGGEHPVRVEVAGEKLVVWQHRGNWSVMKDACAHRLAPLSQGRVDAITGCIECPYHGWQFSGSGKCTKIPQLSSEQTFPKSSTSVTSFPVRVTGDAIWALIPLPAGQVLKTWQTKFL